MSISEPKDDKLLYVISGGRNAKSPLGLSEKTLCGIVSFSVCQTIVLHLEGCKAYKLSIEVYLIRLLIVGTNLEFSHICYSDWFYEIICNHISC